MDPCGFFNVSKQVAHFLLLPVLLYERNVRVCGDAVLRYFWCGFAVVFIFTLGIAVSKQ